jgi:hypothetical protein
VIQGRDICREIPNGMADIHQNKERFFRRGFIIPQKELLL